MYNDFIVMPRQMLAVSGAGAVWPDGNSIISSQLHRRLHHRSWEQLHDCPDAWSMLTTALPETTGGGEPVPIWSADAVVLAGPWSAQQADHAVEMVTLPALIGQASPTLIVPTCSDVPELGLEDRGRVRLWRAAEASLSRIAHRTAGLLTVNGTQVCVREKGENAPAEAVSDEQWKVLRRVLPPEPIRRRRGRPFDPRPSFEGVLWHERTGRSWEQMPDEFGTFKAVLWNQGRWRKDGTLDALYKLLLPYEPLSADKEISDATWVLIDRVLQSSGGRWRKAHTRWRNRRQTLEGILYKFHTGQSWRKLPERFGPGDTLRDSFSRWVSDGTWDLLLAAVEKAPEADRLNAIDGAARRRANRGPLAAAPAPRSAPTLPARHAGHRGRTLTPHQRDHEARRRMTAYHLRAVDVRGMPEQADDDLPGSVMTAAAAHFSARQVRAELGARRVCVLLARKDSTYLDCSAMPRWILASGEGEDARPDSRSIISQRPRRRLPEVPWAHLPDRPAWSVLTTALPETRPGVAPVPIWSADTVVLAGRWSPKEAVRAVERMTLPSLLGEAVPTVVLPALGDQPQAGHEKNVRMQVWRAVIWALSAAADRTGGLVTVNGEPAPMGARDGYDPFDFMSDEQWRMLRHMAPSAPDLPHSDLRPYLDGALWCIRSGHSWEDLPAQLSKSDGGHWHRQWIIDGTLDTIRRTLIPYPSPAEGDGTTEMATWDTYALTGVSHEV